MMNFSPPLNEVQASKFVITLCPEFDTQRPFYFMLRELNTL